MSNTLYRAGDALPMFNVERVTGQNREMVYDAAGHAHYVIDRNEVVYSLANNTVAYWVSGNYLIAPGGRPAFYFDLTREDELADYLQTKGADAETIKRWRQAFGCNFTEAQSIIAALGD
jgi:hypothetical protein